MSQAFGIDAYVEFCVKPGTSNRDNMRYNNNHYGGFRVGRVRKISDDTITVVTAPYKLRGPEARYAHRMRVKIDEIVKVIRRGKCEITD